MYNENLVKVAFAQWKLIVDRNREDYNHLHTFNLYDRTGPSVELFDWCFSWKLLLYGFKKCYFISVVTFNKFLIKCRNVVSKIRCTILVHAVYYTVVLLMGIRKYSFYLFRCQTKTPYLTRFLNIIFIIYEVVLRLGWTQGAWTITK